MSEEIDPRFQHLSVVETVYSYLIHRFAKAFREGDRPLQDEIDASMKLFEKLWPEDIKRWNDRYGDKTAPHPREQG